MLQPRPRLHSQARSASSSAPTRAASTFQRCRSLRKKARLSQTSFFSLCVPLRARCRLWTDTVATTNRLKLQRTQTRTLPGSSSWTVPAVRSVTPSLASWSHRMAGIHLACARRRTVKSVPRAEYVGKSVLERRESLCNFLYSRS